MCPAGYRFWRGVEFREIFNRVTAAPNELFTIGPNPERVGFVLATAGAVIEWTIDDPSFTSIVGSIAPGNIISRQELTVANYGQLMLRSWTFRLQTAGNTYRGWELRTNQEFQ